MRPQRVMCHLLPADLHDPKHGEVLQRAGRGLGGQLGPAAGGRDGRQERGPGLPDRRHRTEGEQHPQQRVSHGTPDRSALQPLRPGRLAKDQVPKIGAHLLSGWFFRRVQGEIGEIKYSSRDSRAELSYPKTQHTQKPETFAREIVFTMNKEFVCFCSTLNITVHMSRAP